jgi:FkbM family methyltransferase
VDLTFSNPNQIIQFKVMNIRTLVFKLMVERLPLFFNAFRRFQNWSWFYRTPKQNPHGFLFAGRPDMETGVFESNEVTDVLKILESVSVVVNVGANCGYYSCLARKRGKQVIAIEPLALNFRILLRNLLLNGWEDVEAYPVGISDQPGIVKLFGASTQASLLPGWSRDNSNRYTVIPVTTLDLLLGDRLNHKRALFIVDIEGAEYRLLLGAAKQLSIKPKPIWMVEIDVSMFQPQAAGGNVTSVPVNPNLLQTFNLFWEQGYTCKMVGEKGLAEAVPVTRSQVVDWSQGRNQPDHYNFIFE